MDICKEIWLQIDSLVGSNLMQIIMVILRTNPRDFGLCVILFPLSREIHHSILRRRYNQQPFPEILVFIITVLFYKHWLLMMTRRLDYVEHKKLARTSLKENLGRIPQHTSGIYDGFIRRIDDRINHAHWLKRSAEYVNFEHFYFILQFIFKFLIVFVLFFRQLFRTKFEVKVAITNFFREYDKFVFEIKDNGLSDGVSLTKIIYLILSIFSLYYTIHFQHTNLCIRSSSTRHFKFRFSALRIN